MRSYRTVIVPEMNMGQLCRVVRAEFLVDAKPITKIQGQPFKAGEIEHAIVEHLS